jgi:hypothetical protein
MRMLWWQLAATVATEFLCMFATLALMDPDTPLLFLLNPLLDIV